jgi:Ser/Thr protein kinase RdoA (MazF antagonist)
LSEPPPLQKIAEGREAEMFARGDDCVVRLYRRDVGEAEIAHQIRSLEVAAACGIRVPTVYGREWVDGRPGVLLERLQGRDLLGVIGRRPWRVWSLARLSGRLHATINSAVAPPGLRSTHDLLRSGIGRSGASPEYARAALHRLDSLPPGDRLCHGDFHPGNIMLHQGEPVVIDWVNLSRGPAEADFARTTMMIRLGDPPPGSPFLIRALARVARSLLLGSYVRAYRERLPLDQALVEAWYLPVAVSRLSEGIAEERPALERFIRRRLSDR